jgi:glycosyltransferase involved in cell wall biosynthesis
MTPLSNYIIVITSLTVGGAEHQALQYALALKRLEIGNPIIVSIGSSGLLTKQLEDLEIEFTTYDTQHFFGLSRLRKIITLIGFARFIRALKPHTIIAFTHWPNLICGSIWRTTGANRFFWNQRSVDSNIAFTIWERLAIFARPNYLSNGQAGLNFIAERHQIKSEDVHIIPNAISVPSATFVSSAVKNPELVNLVMVANFFPEKDHATLLKAVRLYLDRKDSRKIMVHLIGSAPGNSPALIDMKSLAFELLLENNVIFHDKQESVDSFLLAADIGVLSTRSEGVSNAILEYMAYGLPVIASDILANREALGSENLKWLFPVEDHERLSDLLAVIIAHPERAIFGKLNRDYVKKRNALTIFEQSIKETLAKN